VLVRELHGTIPIVAGAGLKQCCASINFSTYQTRFGIRGFSSSFPNGWHVWNIWYCFVGGLKFQRLIFTSRGPHIEYETLQNFINKHTTDVRKE
jgi:hypothetical protein